MPTAETPAAEATAAAPAAPAAAPAAPPWGSDADFDPARAWSLISKLREEAGALKTDRDTLKADVDARTAAEQTEAERIAARATQAEERATLAERALWTERALRKHPLPAGLAPDDEADFLAFLTGETAEEIERKAARLAALSGAGKTATEGDEDGTGQAPAEIPGRPQPVMAPVPGHGGTQPEPFDARAIAKAARGRR